MEKTCDLHNPEIFRRWTAISVIAAVLEQKVWLFKRKLHPNLYIWLVGHPGIGKTRSISEGRRYATGIDGMHFAPVSVTFASLVDALVKSKRHAKSNEVDFKYNSLYICADELGAFMHQYAKDMIDGLSAFYDPTPYQQTRRGNDIDIKIPSPQVNILCGCTPQNLTDFMPEKAWGQGFTSRLIMIFSDERILGDDFNTSPEIFSPDLAHDLALINNLVGEFTWTDEYANAIRAWRELGEMPIPNHPKLIHYVTRRRAHLYKLSMVASVDRGDSLVLTLDDFNRAMGWMLDAERTMLEIFKAGATNADAAAMDEIVHMMEMTDGGKGVCETRIVGFARDKLPIQSILKIIEVLVGSGQIYQRRRDITTGLRYFSVTPPTTSSQDV